MTQFNTQILNDLTTEEKLRLYDLAKRRWIDVGVNDDEKDKIVEAFLWALENVLYSKKTSQS